MTVDPGPPTRFVLLGAGGILGSGFRAALGRRADAALRIRPNWAEPSTVTTLLTGPFAAHAASGQRTAVVWAAGVGTISAHESVMRAETEALSHLHDSIRRLPAEARTRLSVLFASSAGALFGAHGASPVDEDSSPAPVSEYGRVKLLQETMLRRLSEETGCRVLACRYSNLYGLASERLTARGLVSTAVRASRYRQPMIVYVSPDTRRDYVYNQDAAAMALHRLGLMTAGFETALIRDGRSRTVAEVLSTITRVSGRRVPANYAERPETRLQPKVLRFSEPARGALEVRRTPLEVAVHLMLRAPLAV